MISSGIDTDGDHALEVLDAATGNHIATLTLGREPGTNTVSARVAELYRVSFTAIGVAVPRSLTKISGDGEQAGSGASLSEPFAFAGATVTFAVTAGAGTLSTTTAATDANGRAPTTLTLGSKPGTITVVATVAGIDLVTFTATAEATPDFDGDGETGFSDFFLFADAFGGSNPRFDLDGQRQRRLRRLLPLRRPLRGSGPRQAPLPGRCRRPASARKPSASRRTIRVNRWFTARMASTPTATLSATPLAALTAIRCPRQP